MLLRSLYAVLVLLIFFVGYGLWQGAALGTVLATTFLLLTGVGFTIYGLYALLDPQTVARVSEQVDAVGSKTPFSSVEPASWKVSLTKAHSLLILLIGLFNLGMVLFFLTLIS